MTREEFEDRYNLAIGKWECNKDLTYDTDFADEGWAAGYAGCVPDDELLENEAFMDGYDCGYTTRFY